MIDGGSSALYAFFIIVLLSIIFAIFYFNGVLLNRYSKTRYVNVIEEGSFCDESIGTLPVIANLKCDNGSEDLNYYIPPGNYNLEFIISTSPTFYLNVCKGLCDEVNPQGDCVKNDVINPENYLYCISLLEPQEGCNNSAKPVGVLEGTATKYYAKSIKPPSCINL